MYNDDNAQTQQTQQPMDVHCKFQKNVFSEFKVPLVNKIQEQLNWTELGQNQFSQGIT